MRVFADDRGRLAGVCLGPNLAWSAYQSTNRIRHGSMAVCCNSFSANTLPSSNPIASLMRL